MKISNGLVSILSLRVLVELNIVAKQVGDPAQAQKATTL